MTAVSWSEVLLDGSQPAELEQVSGLLLPWYAANRRILPWREEPTPYRVWVSEIMLQQTRVEAVKEYYARFLQALPTVRELAEVEEGRLLKLWEGLGYYNRARNLQRAAGVICREHGGALPASYAQLLQLPGIGEYTAGAVASIAFGIPVPAVDGNVYRVLSRLLATYADTSRPLVKRAFRELAEQLLPVERPGDFNQALMELGATICVPNGPPRCGECPVRECCRSAGQSFATELPVKAAKKARRVEQRTLLFLIDRGRLLLQKRERTGLLPGLYQPLNLEGMLSKRKAGAALEALGHRPLRLHPLADSKHIFSHVEWHMKAYLVFLSPGSPGSQRGPVVGSAEGSGAAGQAGPEEAQATVRQLDKDYAGGVTPPQTGESLPLEQVWVSTQQLDKDYAGGVTSPQTGETPPLEQVWVSAQQLDEDYAGGVTPPQTGEAPPLEQVWVSAQQLDKDYAGGVTPPQTGEAPPLEQVWVSAQQLDKDYALPSAFSAYRGDLPRWLAASICD